MMPWGGLARPLAVLVLLGLAAGGGWWVVQERRGSAAEVTSAASTHAGTASPTGSSPATSTTAAGTAGAATSGSATPGGAPSSGGGAASPAAGAAKGSSPGASPSASKSAAAAAAGPTGPCGRAASTTPRAVVSTVALPVPVVAAGGDSDTAPLPMALAATPSGGSWLAWLGTDRRVHLGRLDCKDALVGPVTSFEGIDLQDVQADANGGVLLLTRSGTCHTGPLCGGTSSPCNTMWMVRFDATGHQVWQQQVTNLTASRGGYDDGARFVWWYQHHGRLASDGTNWAAYFGVAITVRNGSCVDIHEGDRMQVVGPNGGLVAGHGSFEVGCSHAWTSRIVWDPRATSFVTVCATDNDCRIARPAPYRTVVAATCDGTLFGGDLVLAKGSGYWTAWSHGGRARLERFTTGPSQKTVSTGAATSHPHLVGYGADRMLLAWGSGSGSTVQVYDAATGAAVGGRVTVGVRDHPYQAWKAYPDGSVAYPAAGTGSTSVRIARVLPMA